MLLNALAAVYEQLLPLLVRVGSRAGPKAPASLVGPRLRQSILLAAWKLLQHGFLTREGAAGRGAPGLDAQAQGQALVSMLMAISHPGPEAVGAAAAAAQHHGLLHGLNDTYRLDAAVAHAVQLVSGASARSQVGFSTWCRWHCERMQLCSSVVIRHE